MNPKMTTWALLGQIFSGH